MTLTLLLAWAMTAGADLQNMNVLPMGDRQALLGNTGAAIRGSTGAIYYNPAGLAAIEGRRLSASGSTYAVVNASIAEAGGPISFRSLSATPSLVVSARRIGAYTVAFGILAPGVLDVHAEVTQSIPSLNVSGLLVVDSRSEENYLGASMAGTAGDWSWGAGVFLYRATNTSHASMMLHPSSGSLHLAVGTTKRMENYAVLFTGGVQRALTPDLHWGLALHSETTQFSGRADTWEESLVTNGGAPQVQSAKDSHRGNIKLPWQLMSGLEWRRGRHSWFGDVGVTLPASYHSVPNTKYNEVYRSKVTARLNGGYGFQISPEWKAMAGVQYNPSAISRYEGDSPLHASNFLGATAGVYNEDGNVKTGAGLFYLFSRTDRTFFGKAPADESKFTVYGLLLSTAIDY